MSRRATAAWAAVVLAAIQVGCGGDDGDGPPAAAPHAEAPPSAVEADPTAPGDACELITAEEVAALAGTAVRAVEWGTERTGRSTVTECWYEGGDPAASTPYLHTTVYWSGGAEEWRSSARGAQVAEGMLNEPDDGYDPSSLFETRRVDVGDRAIFRALLPSHVLQGDVLIEMEFPALDVDAQGFEGLARTALARLG
ncbi:MAG TPA: hypothetical protein VK837_14450 [Longimicrobiales bacterium]|nr:hypothetical protein [Longimicrobiales bacterium]